MDDLVAEALYETQVPLNYNPKLAIRHVTVSQMLKADRAHSTALFRIDGNEFSVVILLGNLQLVRSSNAYADFDLDDGTGRILVRQWNEDPDNGSDESLRVRGAPYARVVGELDLWNDRKSIRARRISMTSSPYEPYHHIQQAIHDTVAYERGRAGYQPIVPDSQSSKPSQSNRSPSPPLTPVDQSLGVIEQPDVKGKGKARSIDSPMAMPSENGETIYEHSSPPCSEHIAATLPSSPSTLFSPVPTSLWKTGVHNFLPLLPSLDRDILLCVMFNKETAEAPNAWKGVHLSIITAAVCAGRTTLTSGEFWFVLALDHVIWY
ncbi:hypothetical protein DXG01_017150 [Tephrocybe rancida]|nr:hypothetical protein DXG01_017150 [Tephrocybe rancida]